MSRINPHVRGRKPRQAGHRSSEIKQPAANQPERVPDLTHYTGYLLNLVSMTACRDLGSRLAAESLTVVEWKLLRLLYGEPASCPSMLAAKLCVNSGTLTKVADKLLDKGLIERAEDPCDRRSRPLSLAPAGRVKLPKLAVLIRECDEVSFGSLSREEREALDRILRALVDQCESSGT